ncbi:unnamed protein product [[Candida] boidinii]|nr:unnamed protein product [[Candida] boidinii]
MNINPPAQIAPPHNAPNPISSPQNHLVRTNTAGLSGRVPVLPNNNANIANSMRNLPPKGPQGVPPSLVQQANKHSNPLADLYAPPPPINGGMTTPRMSPRGSFAEPMATPSPSGSVTSRKSRYAPVTGSPTPAPAVLTSLENSVGMGIFQSDGSQAATYSQHTQPQSAQPPLAQPPHSQSPFTHPPSNLHAVQTASNLPPVAQQQVSLPPVAQAPSNLPPPVSQQQTPLPPAAQPPSNFPPVQQQSSLPTSLPSAPSFKTASTLPPVSKPPSSLPPVPKPPTSLPPVSKQPSSLPPVSQYPAFETPTKQPTVSKLLEAEPPVPESNLVLSSNPVASNTEDHPVALAEKVEVSPVSMPPTENEPDVGKLPETVDPIAQQSTIPEQPKILDQLVSEVPVVQPDVQPVAEPVVEPVAEPVYEKEVKQLVPETSTVFNVPEANDSNLTIPDEVTSNGTELEDVASKLLDKVIESSVEPESETSTEVKSSETLEVEEKKLESEVKPDVEIKKPTPPPTKLKNPYGLYENKLPTKNPYANTVTKSAKKKTNYSPYAPAGGISEPVNEADNTLEDTTITAQYSEYDFYSYGGYQPPSASDVSKVVDDDKAKEEEESSDVKESEKEESKDEKREKLSVDTLNDEKNNFVPFEDSC